MYRAYLNNIDYFKDLLKTEDIDNVLDSLTQVVARKYIMEYIDYLIDNNTPFAMVILDIDNFKLINDNYGHIVGDQVLLSISRGLINYIGNAGVVGRYGGDEFIIVYLKNNTYEHMYRLLYGMYGQESVLRKTLFLDGVSPFVTGTFGSASFPLDADNKNDLFLNADKALYRGKTKGRNCFIVYVHSKHKDINVNQIVRQPLHRIMYNIGNIVDSYPHAGKSVVEVLNYINSILNNSNIMYIDNNFRIYRNGKLIFDVKAVLNLNVEALLDEYGFFECNNLNHLKNASIDLYNLCVENDILSILISRVSVKGKNYGYLILTDDVTERIWQDEDKALTLYVCKLLGLNKVVEQFL